jgi:hypothetical protein
MGLLLSDPPPVRDWFGLAKSGFALVVLLDFDLSGGQAPVQ